MHKTDLCILYCGCFNNTHSQRQVSIVLPGNEALLT